MIQGTQSCSVIPIYPVASIPQEEAIFPHSIFRVSAKPAVTVPIEQRTSAVVLFIIKGYGMIKEENLYPMHAVYIPKGEQLVELISGINGLEYLMIRSSVKAAAGDASFFVEEMNRKNPYDKDCGHVYNRNWLNPEHGKERLEIPYSIGMTKIQPGKSEPPIYWGNLFHYIIEGQATFKVEGFEQKLKSGDSVIMDKTWQMGSSNDRPLKYLTIVARCWKKSES